MNQISTHLNLAQEEIGTVRTDKYEYTQRLSYDAQRPWEVEISLIRSVLKNGKSEAESFVLNLADLDPRLIQYRDDRREQTVVLRTKGGQKLIEVTGEDGGVSYRDELSIRTLEIDQAKTLRDLLREAVPPAREAWEADFTPGSTLGSIQEYVSKSVTPLERNGREFSHTWTVEADNEDVITYTVTDEEDGTDTNYRFGLSDLAVNSVQLKTSRNQLYVEVKTVAGEDLILKSDQEGPVAYINRLHIPVDGIEEGRRLVRSLQSAIPLAKSYRTSLLPQTGNMSEDLGALAELVQQAEVSHQIEVQLEGGPASRLVVESTDNKGQRTVDEYVFDFGDLDPGGIDIVARGANLFLVIPVKDRQKFVQRSVDGEARGFEQQIRLPLQTVEDGKLAEHLLIAILEESATREVAPADLAWLDDRLGAAGPTETTQHLSSRQGANSDCQWQYIRTTEGKRPKEEIFEFNLYDLNPKQIQILTNKEVVLVRIPTIKQEKIINVYDNDEPAFTDELELRLFSLQDARRARATLIERITNCQ
jgi:hypothetical protein